MGITIQLPKLHGGGQETFVRSPARFKLGICGRQWGKTSGAALWATHEILQGKTGMWTAPTYSMARIGWSRIQGMCRQIPGMRVMSSSIQYSGQREYGIIHLRSADRPDRLRGHTLDFLGMDEAALMASNVFHEILRPALAAKRGKCLILTTPRGNNWIRDLANSSEWELHRHPSSDNPFLPPDEIAAMRKTMTAAKASQELDAAFVDFEGRLLHWDASQVVEVQDGPVLDHVYGMGIDWGRVDDSTVIGIVDATTNSLVSMTFLNCSYDEQANIVASMYERWKPGAVYAESNGVGLALCDAIAAKNVPLVPFTMTHDTKIAIVDQVELALERKMLKLCNEPEALRQFELFTATKMPSGLVRYSAPVGEHDDAVIALALAWQAAQSAGTQFVARMT